MIPDSYFAGLFDGEGWVTLQRRQRNPNQLGFTLTVGVKMTTKEPVLALYGRFGGTFSHTPSTNPNHNDSYTWRVCSVDAADALSAMLPWLIAKREHAIVGIEAGEYLASNRTPGRKTDPSEFPKRRAILDKFAALPKRGANPRR